LRKSKNEYDEIEDKIVCGKNSDDGKIIISNYQCQINTNRVNIKSVVINNNECADYYIGAE
jgi:hypothetical protein